MLSFYVTNLLIPDDPDDLTITTPAGLWTLTKAPNFVTTKAAITGTTLARPQHLPVGETYFLESPISMDRGAAAVDRAFDEITPILLAASYATGMSVTINRSTMGSSVSIMQPSDHWPRARALGSGSYVISTSNEFSRLVEVFVRVWPTMGQTEKARLLVHHWLDALACWSMEDQYLSATTLLQIIVATEAQKQGKASLTYYNGLEDAANRMGIAPLSQDFKNMRNELIHDGQLIGSRFVGPRSACDQVVADVLNWFDTYVHAGLGLGPVAKTRFGANDFATLNAYSI